MNENPQNLLLQLKEDLIQKFDDLNIAIIVARSKNNVIGGNNQLLWNIREDLQHFKKLTTEKIVIMGFNTFKSLNFKPLKNRLNIVLTSKSDNLKFLEEDNLLFANNIPELFELLKSHLSQFDNKEIMIIGGGKIYQEFLSIADVIYLTEIDLEVEGDSYFLFNQEEFCADDYWYETVKEAKRGIDLYISFQTLRRKAK